jgi:DNA replicative helicase MCM subunit Mcm2 (Cdc46/Mcm family)
VEFAKQAGEIKWEEETRPLWASIYPELSEGKPGIIGAITARAEAQVTRLACIFALLDCSAVIKVSHLKAALEVWSYAEASVQYIFQNTMNDPLANKILEALAVKPHGMTRTEINNLLGGNYRTTRITEVLNELRGAGLADKKTSETGGRPSERWFLAQSVTEKTEKTEKGVN